MEYGFYLVFVATLLLTLAGTLLFVGQIFALVAVPTLSQKEGWKYGLLIASFSVPFLGAIICLCHYQKTRYASNFILWGLAFGLLGGGFLYIGLN